jgi:DNA-binding MarR family transcriptional regulator
VRDVLPHNRRQRALSLTAAGQRLLDASVPATQRLRERLLAPLSPAEQDTFMALLAKLVQENNTHSRAPLLAQPPQATQ